MALMRTFDAIGRITNALSNNPSSVFMRFTALMRAAFYNKPDCVSHMLDSNATANLTTTQGRTALHFAVILGPDYLRIVNIFTSHDDAKSIGLNVQDKEYGKEAP